MNNFVIKMSKKPSKIFFTQTVKFCASITGKAFSIAFIFIIHIYQVIISPVLPSSCRYSPTCSVYAKEALKKHGFLSGIKLILRRLAKCHPWSSFGYDPVP